MQKKENAMLYDLISARLAVSSAAGIVGGVVTAVFGHSRLLTF
jgi:hypothetical protein